jgi:hypothetical protein
MAATTSKFRSAFSRLKKGLTATGSAGMKSIGRKKRSELSVGGIDSVQTLVLALKTIGAEIYSSSYHESGKLFVDKPGGGYGFPVVPTHRDLLQGDDKKYL